MIYEAAVHPTNTSGEYYLGEAGETGWEDLEDYLSDLGTWEIVPAPSMACHNGAGWAFVQFVESDGSTAIVALRSDKHTPEQIVREAVRAFSPA